MLEYVAQQLRIQRLLALVRPVFVDRPVIAREDGEQPRAVFVRAPVEVAGDAERLIAVPLRKQRAVQERGALHRRIERRVRMRRSSFRRRVQAVLEQKTQRVAVVIFGFVHVRSRERAFEKLGRQHILFLENPRKHDADQVAQDCLPPRQALPALQPPHPAGDFSIEPLSKGSRLQRREQGFRRDAAFHSSENPERAFDRKPGGRRGHLRVERHRHVDPAFREGGETGFRGPVRQVAVRENDRRPGATGGRERAGADGGVVSAHAVRRIPILHRRRDRAVVRNPRRRVQQARLAADRKRGSERVGVAFPIFLIGVQVNARQLRVRAEVRVNARRGEIEQARRASGSDQPCDDGSRRVVL